MLIKISASTGPFKEALDIADKNEIKKTSWITLFIGENGTQKSRLLRFIADTSTGSAFPKAAGFHKSGIAVERTDDSKFNRVIALSGTPLDRFPRSRTLTGFRKSAPFKTAQDTFIYFGQRASNGVASSNESAKALVASFLSNRDRLSERKDALHSVFSVLDLQPEIRVKFSVSRTQNEQLSESLLSGDIDAFVEKLRHYSTSYTQILLKRGITKYTDARDASIIIKNLNDDTFLKRAFEILSNLDDRPYLLLSTARNTVRRQTLPLAFWRMLLAVGTIEIGGISVKPGGGTQSLWPNVHSIPGSYLSSGQWGWLSTLGGLAVEIEDNTLVLIDEPENSLHPAWQQAYVPTLLEILSKYVGCHTIVATHAPLIASGLPPDCGNIRRLIREPAEDGAPRIRSYSAKNTFGWSASDTYEELFQLESTRAEIFNSYAQEALHLVRAGAGNKTEINRLTNILQTLRSNLPILDPMRHVIGDVMTSLDRISQNSVKSGDAHE